MEVLVLIHAGVHESAIHSAPRIQRSRYFDIRRAKFDRFSHQCSAFKHTAEKDKCPGREEKIL